MHKIKTPHCARFSLVWGYPCVCPFGALTYLLRKKILFIVLEYAFPYVIYFIKFHTAIALFFS